MPLNSRTKTRLHNNYSACTKNTHPSLCCNCPIKIFPLEDVSHYRPAGSLWSCLQPIIWASTSGEPLRPERSSQAERAKCPVLLISTLTGERGKTENWPLAIVSRQLHSAPLPSQVTGRLTFYHRNNDLFLCQGLAGLPRGARHLRRRVTVFGRGRQWARRRGGGVQRSTLW